MRALLAILSGPCIGDTFSSSPSSTPMGSMESLSSHSSEQNTSSKPASCGQVRANLNKSVTDLCRTPSQRSNGPRSAVCVSSPESSSREDTGRTDGESEDALSLSSVSSTPRLSPAPQKAPHCYTDLKAALMNRSASPSLKSLHIHDGRMIVRQMNLVSFPFTVTAWTRFTVSSCVVMMTFSRRLQAWRFGCCFSITLTLLCVIYKDWKVFMCMSSPRPQELLWICPKFVHTGDQREFEAHCAPRSSTKASDPSQNGLVRQQRLSAAWLSVTTFIFNCSLVFIAK